MSKSSEILPADVRPDPDGRPPAILGPRTVGRRVASAHVARWAERGSQTTEYALLLIVAATIAVLALNWARQGAITTVLDAVLDKVLALFGIVKR